MAIDKEMPMGFAFQMALNEKAMENFARMTDTEKQQVLDAARSVHSKKEMKGIVEDLGNMS